MALFAVTVDDPDHTQAYHFPDIQADSERHALVEGYRRANESDPNGVTDIAEHELARMAETHAYLGAPRDSGAALPPPGEFREGDW